MARSSLPPGFRFHPTDEELLVHYLRKKVAGRRVYDGVIGEVEIYRFEPPDLPGLAALQSNDQEWFFFNAQDKKYLHGARTNRTTRAGYWKATGKDRKISAGSCTGMKKTLIYYLGRAPHGERTDWLMHEYRLDEEFEKKINPTKPFVLCRIRRKGGLGPRNGEQYGAPVLEAFEDDEGGASTSYQLEDTNVLPPAESNFVEEHNLDMPHVAIHEGATTRGRVGIGDDIDSFLQDLIFYEELEQQRAVQDEVLSVDDLLDFVDDLNNFAPPQERPVNSMDLEFEDIDGFFNLLHTATDNESAILEDMLHLASGQAEAPDGFSGSRALLELSSQQIVEAEDGGGFIELADLEEPCEGQGTLESSDIEGLLYDLDNGLESARLAEERLEMQNSGDRQSSGILQLDEESGMGNEPLALEVPLGSSQGLSILDSIYTKFLTSDDGGGFSDDLPSGFDLISGCEGGLPNNSHSSGESEVRTEHQPARVDDLLGGNLDTQGGIHSVASVSHEESEAAHVEHVSINSNTSEQPNSTAGLPNRVTSSVGSFASSPSSPSPLARVISEVLGKINVLPASAEGMAVELGRHKPLLMDSSNISAVGSKVPQLALNHHNFSPTSSASLHFRVKLIDLEHSAKTPEMELHLLVSHAVSKQASTKSWRSLTNVLTTTLVALLFWMLRGFCRSMQSAF